MDYGLSVGTISDILHRYILFDLTPQKVDFYGIFSSFCLFFYRIFFISELHKSGSLAGRPPYAGSIPTHRS